MIQVIFVFLTLALVIFLAFRKWNIIVVSIIAAGILALLSGQNILEAFTVTFATGLSGYVKNFFLLFVVSALFGKFMEESGAAASIAKSLARLFGQRFAILGVLFAGMLLCYGGISALVIAFTMYPIALAVFKRADLPRRLIPGVIAAGCFTFAATCLPGTPQTINMVPIPYLSTTVSAAPVLGIICGAIGIVLTALYIYREGAKARKKEEHFEADDATLEVLAKAETAGEGVNPFLAVVPMIVVIVLLVAFKLNAHVALLIACAVCYALFFKNIGNPMPAILAAVQSGTGAAITTGAIVGYGSVVSASAGYAILSDAMVNMNASPLISYSLTTTVLAGAAGSGTGGLAIALNNLAPKFIEMGISPEVLHRIGCMAATGLDSLPHNGAVVVLLTLSGMTHKDSYKQIFITTVVLTLIVCVIGILLATAGIC
ncbi:MAG: GntP family permease [Lachnospiraceae bacterium]|nr:GntP family permease [Lachnospiraceae bacterium]